MRLLMLAAAFSLCASLAVAQDMAAQPGPQNPAVKTTERNNSSTPVSGANSFTRGEAKSRMEAQGYSGVTHLRKDGGGVWRATAMKDGKSAPVSLDYQGNVN